MRPRFFGVSVLMAFALIIPALLASGQQRRGPAAAGKQPPPSIRIKYKTTTAGQSYESTTMIKGSRERNEMRTGGGMDTISITQCDLKRTIQLNDRVKKYVITPMETTTAEGDSSQPITTNTSAQPEPARRGGLITYTTTATDTGERKEMFGFTASHVKTSMTIESSPDSCSPVNQRMETDGWYIDLSFGLECDLGRAQAVSRPAVAGGCRDRVQFRRQGTAKRGYPLVETTTMYGPDGRAMFTTTKEVVELSREPLDAALFDVPPGYTEAASTQEFYAVPSVAELMAQANAGATAPSTAVNTSRDNASAGGDTKAPGVQRVGVVKINNRTGKSLVTDTLRDRLVRGIESAGIDAVALNAISPAEAEVEAKVKQCDFILYTDITGLKSSAAKKLGGMFGRVAGVEGVAKTEARADFKLFAIGESSPKLQSSVSAKEEGDELSAGTAMDLEARQVSGAVRKK